MTGVLRPLVMAMAIVLVAAAPAQAWDAQLASHPRLPSTFLAIDKSTQQFYIYSQKSPLREIGRLPCATGQAIGDKQAQGDLRTPEGVYFIERRLTSGLDYELYGDQAFTLNYPNPVDRIRGKTGSGIWIHGRGDPVTPRETRGCVALNTPDLAAIQDTLGHGMPVAIADRLSVEPTATLEEVNRLVDLVQGWASAWQSESDEFFSYYDAERFGLSQGRSFNAFKAHKRRVFRASPWLQVMADDVRVMPGPDYWVTWFNQFYRTPTMVSQGVKRLYWQRDDQGALRIVGKEWVRTPVDLADRYLDRVRSEVEPMLGAWREAWLQADLDGYLAFYDAGADQGDRVGREAIAEHKREIWGRNAPSRVALGEPLVAMHPQGVQVRFSQDYASQGGYEDHGVKTLVLAPRDKGWAIVSETWSAE